MLYHQACRISTMHMEVKFQIEVYLVVEIDPRSKERNFVKILTFWLAREVSWLAVEVLSPLKIKVKISETKYRSFYKTLRWGLCVQLYYQLSSRVLQ